MPPGELTRSTFFFPTAPPPAYPITRGRLSMPPGGVPYILYIKKPSSPGAGGFGSASRSISRVLSWTTIHLRQLSPAAWSDLPEPTAGHGWRVPIWSCSGWGLPSPRLLPAARCALTAPFHPYPTKTGDRPRF